MRKLVIFILTIRALLGDVVDCASCNFLKAFSSYRVTGGEKESMLWECTFSSTHTYQESTACFLVEWAWNCYKTSLDCQNYIKFTVRFC